MSHFLSTHLEILATLAGLINIYLIARANIWNWFFGIITVSLYMLIFFQVKLYADMSLQFIFLCIQFYGIYQWLYGSDSHSALSITRASHKILLFASFTSVILFCAITFFLKNYTDSTTFYIDAFTTALSLVAQWMMSKKYLEHWWFWMVVNIISIDMYFYKHLYFTSGLYAIFLIMCILGFITWKKQSYLKLAVQNA